MEPTLLHITALASSPTERVVGMAVVIGVGVALGVAFLMLARRRLLRAERESAQPMTLGQARELRAQGRISEEEFESLRSALVRASGGTGAPGSRPHPGRHDTGEGRADQSTNGE